MLDSPNIPGEWNNKPLSLMTPEIVDALLDKNNLCLLNGMTFWKISNLLPEDKRIYDAFLETIKNDRTYQKMFEKFPPMYRIKENNKIRVFSKVLQLWDKKRITGYDLNPPKVFCYRKSCSESYWRFCPEWWSTISKAQQIPWALYESTTKIGYFYNIIFNKFSEWLQNRASPATERFAFLPDQCKKERKNWTMIPTDIPSLQNELKIIQLFPKYYYPDHYSKTKQQWIYKSNAANWWLNYEIFENWVIQRQTSENLKKKFKSIDLNTFKKQWLDTDHMKIIFKQDDIHEFLNKPIKRYWCETEYQWEKVHIMFSREEGDPRIRIESAFSPDAWLTSHKVYKRQLNMGPFMMKPVEYANQCTSDFQNCWEEYVDIRDLYNETPFMRKLSWLADEFDQNQTS